MGHTTLSATSSIVTLLEPSRRQTGRRDWRASSVLPPRRTWAIGPHNPSLPPPLLSQHTLHSYHTHSLTLAYRLKARLCSVTGSPDII